MATFHPKTDQWKKETQKQKQKTTKNKAHRHNNEWVGSFIKTTTAKPYACVASWLKSVVEPVARPKSLWSQLSSVGGQCNGSSAASWWSRDKQRRYFSSDSSLCFFLCRTLCVSGCLSVCTNNVIVKVGVVAVFLYFLMNTEKARLLMSFFTLRPTRERKEGSKSIFTL